MSQFSKIWRKVRASLLSLRTRQFQAYAIGGPKTGTTSLASLFASRFHSAHEAAASELQEMVIRDDSRLQTAAGRDAYVRDRDRRVLLEMDSSNLHLHYLDSLPRSFPAAKFVVLIREPLTWLRSRIDHLQPERESDVQRRYRRKILLPLPALDDELERPLRDINYPSLNTFVADWLYVHATPFRHVPRDRRLILETEKISQSLPQLASFLDIPVATLLTSKDHANKTRTRLGILERLPGHYLDRCLESVWDRVPPELMFFRDITRDKLSRWPVGPLRLTSRTTFSIPTSDAHRAA